MTWQRLHPASQVPSPRCSHAAAAVHDERYIIFFGGAFYRAPGQLELVQDVFTCYDTIANAFVPVAGRAASEGTSGGLPCPRNAGVMVRLSNGQLLCHGGWKPFQVTYSDTHVLELQ